MTEPAQMDAVRSAFRTLDEQAHARFATIGQQGLDALFASNRQHYSDAEPALSSIFLNVPLLGSEVMQRVLWLRGVIARNVSQPTLEGVRWAEAGTQHCTVLTVVRQRQQLNSEMLSLVAESYRDLVAKLRSFTIHVMGPHLASDGAVVLECAVDDDTLFAIRNADVGRKPDVVPDLLHSTVAFLSQATIAECQALIREFEQARTHLRPVAVRVNDIAVNESRNRAHAGDTICLPLGDDVERAAH